MRNSNNGQAMAAALNGSARPKQKKLTRTLKPYLFLLPITIFTIVFSYYPFLKTFVFSLCKVNARGQIKKFVGISNYIDILQREDFQNAIIVSLKFVVMYVPFAVLIPFLLALIANRPDRASENSILATWDFIKYLATPEVSAEWFMNTGYYPMNMEAMENEAVKALVSEYPQYGIINTILEHSAGYTNYTEPWIPSFTDTDNLVQDEIIKLSEGSQDISTTIANIDAGATQKLNDYISAN